MMPTTTSTSRINRSSAYDKYVKSGSNNSNNDSKNNTCSNTATDNMMDDLSDYSLNACQPYTNYYLSSSSSKASAAGNVSPSMLSGRTRRSSPVIISSKENSNNNKKSSSFKINHHHNELYNSLGRPTLVLPLPSCLEPVRSSSTASTQSCSTTSSNRQRSLFVTPDDNNNEENEDDVVVVVSRQNSVTSSSSRCTNTSTPSSSSSKNINNSCNNTKKNANNNHNNKLISHTVYNYPEPLRSSAWAEGDGTQYSVRGKTYLSDGGKKVPSSASIFSLLTIDILQQEEQQADGESSSTLKKGICNHPKERIQQALKREEVTGTKELPPFVFVVNLVIPGPPTYHLILYFGCNDIGLIKPPSSPSTSPPASSVSSNSNSNDNSCNNSTNSNNSNKSVPFSNIAQQFFFGSCNSSSSSNGDDEEYCNERFKLIPRITKGNFIVKNAVGTKPAILGKKLKQTYIRDPNGRFFELICDIGSNPIAQRVTKLCTGYAKSLEVEMAFVLEGKEVSTLPEQIIGVAVLKNVDFEKQDGKRKISFY